MVSAAHRKNILIGFNVVYAALAIAILILGIQSDDDNGMRTIFIVSGALALVVAAIGLAGAIIQNVCLLRTFGVLVGIIVAMNVFSGISYIRLSASAKDKLDVLFQYYKDVPMAETSLNTVQSKLHCCGVESPDGWTKYYPKGEFPPSCCPSQPHNDTQVCTATAGAYETGCLSAMRRAYGNYGIAAFVVSSLQVVAIVLSCSLPDKTPPISFVTLA